MADIGEMSDAEILAYADRLRTGGNLELVPQPDPVVTIDGHEYRISAAKLTSWKATVLVARMQAPDADEAAQTFAAIEFFQYVMGEQMADVLEACGGEDASAADVVALVGRILAEAAPKN